MNFENIYSEIKPLTLIENDRCRMLYRLSRYVACLPGSMAELGVYQGGSSILLALANPGKKIHAFDTFQGLHNASATHDWHTNGEFSDINAGTIARLRAEKIQVNVGKFPDTTEICRNEKFCFAHFDGDTYQSCRDFLDFFWPRMVNGGIMVFDDWRNEHCKGVEKALTIHSLATGAVIFPTAKWQAAITVTRKD